MKLTEIAYHKITEKFFLKIFEPLRKDQPNFADQIIPIYGSLDELELNISQYDQAILVRNIQIIIHSAADVRFDVFDIRVQFFIQLQL